MTEIKSSRIVFGSTNSFVTSVIVLLGIIVASLCGDKLISLFKDDPISHTELQEFTGSFYDGSVWIFENGCCTRANNIFLIHENPVIYFQFTFKYTRPKKNYTYPVKYTCYDPNQVAIYSNSIQYTSDLESFWNSVSSHFLEDHFVYPNGKNWIVGKYYILIDVEGTIYRGDFSMTP